MKVGEVLIPGADSIRTNAGKGMEINQVPAANVSQPAAAKGDSVSFSSDIDDVMDPSKGHLQLPKFMSETPDANGNVQTRSFL